MFNEPEANNCFRIIFGGKYQDLQNNGLKQKNTDAIVRVHARTYAAVVLMISLYVYQIVNQFIYQVRQKKKQTSETLRIINFIRHLCFSHGCSLQSQLSSSPKNERL